MSSPKAISNDALVFGEVRVERETRADGERPAALDSEGRGYRLPTKGL